MHRDRRTSRTLPWIRRFRSPGRHSEVNDGWYTIFRIVWTSTAILAGLGLAACFVYRLWPRSLEFHPVAFTPQWERVGEREIVKLPGRFLVAEIGVYDDELFAYLMFQYFRGADALKDTKVLLTYHQATGRLLYAIEVQMENDLLASIPLLARARTSGLIKGYRWRYLNQDNLNSFLYQTQLFETAYSLPTSRKIEDMSRTELMAYVRRFIRFKSAVDPRTRRRIEPITRPLTNCEANQLAVDIVTIADFYSLPVELFLGIGAMENNYINVKGDLRHAIWKRSALRGDIVLKRRPGGVLVLNPASGVWQITRETLRYVHNLYLVDRRDYSTLPEHLRPHKQLNVDDPDSKTLTTYAGLLFRQLLDQFQGNASMAVGAYNGGPGNPNARYEAGVRMVAEYARQVMQNAAALQGRPAAGMRFMRPRN